MNIPTETVIYASLFKLFYLKGILAAKSDTLPFYDYRRCVEHCDSLINLFKGMLDEEEGD